LVTEFDEEELPLKRQEQFEQLVVDNNGSESRAQAQMALEKSVYDDYRDFMQLLTDAAMNPEESKSSTATQKFATALSRNNIVTAFNDITAKNRIKVPYDIEINVDNFNDKTQNGEDEEEVLNRFEELIEQEKQEELSKAKLDLFQQFCLYGWAADILYGIIKTFMDKSLAFITIIIGIGLIIYHFTSKSKLQKIIQQIIEAYDKKLESGQQIIRAIIAEIVDFRIEFNERDAESSKVLDFFEQIRPEEYIRKIGTNERKIM